MGGTIIITLYFAHAVIGSNNNPKPHVQSTEAEGKWPQLPDHYSEGREGRDPLTNRLLVYIIIVQFHNWAITH